MAATVSKDTLMDVQVIKTMLQKNIPIQTGNKDDNGDPEVISRCDFPCFAVIRNVVGNRIDLEAKAKESANRSKAKTEAEWQVKFNEKLEELQNKYATVATIMKLASGTAVATMDGYYVVPIYAGMVEVKPLQWYRDRSIVPAIKTLQDDEDAGPKMQVNDYDKLKLAGTLFEIPADTFKLSDMRYWADDPTAMFNNAAKAAGTKYVLEAIIKLRTDDDVIQALGNCCKNIDIVRKVRVSMGNSITNNCYHILGKEAFDALKADMLKDNPNTTYIKEAYKEFKEILENRPISEITGKAIKITVSNFKSSRLIPRYMIWEMLQTYHMEVLAEEHLDKSVKELVKDHPFWRYFLEGIKGCGFKHAGYIISGLDCRVCRHPSGWLRYLGLDVVWNEEQGKFRGRNKNYLREVPIVTTDGEVQVIKTLGYDTKMKSRVYLLATNILKSKDPYYEKVYRDAYTYYTNRPDLAPYWEEKPKKNTPKKGNVKNEDPDQETVKKSKPVSSPHYMALRKLMSTFIIDLWKVERRILGLPLNGGSYAEEKLGIHHGYQHEPPMTESWPGPVYED